MTHADVAVVQFELNGAPLTVPADAGSLLDAIRDHTAIRSVKDGCSPQGQCGCCTVWVDGQPRVACVTAVSRVRDRSVTTLEGIPDAHGWCRRFADAAASQCGFCTPGIIMRCAALVEPTADDVAHALLAHVCRCTGWQTIIEAVTDAGTATEQSARNDPADRRATVEGGASQRLGPRTAAGGGGFCSDTAPAGAAVALRNAAGEWAVGDSVAHARRLASRVQGRRTTLPLRWPVDAPQGDFVATLQTTWVEPAYLEPDAAWCQPGETPHGPAGNGGAFGAKATSMVGDAARQLADALGRPVLAMFTREDIVQFGPKRPPIGAGVRADGHVVIHAARTAGLAATFADDPTVTLVEVDAVGPPTSTSIRAAGWAEIAVLRSRLADPTKPITIASPSGGVASASIDIVDGREVIDVTVSCGDVLDERTLRSYCIGAAHMALGWVRHEAIAVDDNGEPADLTMRSFGILRAADMPRVAVHVVDAAGPAVNGSDAVFAAVAAAAWRLAGWPSRWPTMRR